MVNKCEHKSSISNHGIGSVVQHFVQHGHNQKDLRLQILKNPNSRIIMSLWLEAGGKAGRLLVVLPLVSGP